jgi:enoyl-CoA hydratase
LLSERAFEGSDAQVTPTLPVVTDAGPMATSASHGGRDLAVGIRSQGWCWAGCCDNLGPFNECAGGARVADVLSEQRDHGVAVVTLNRPDRRNALSAALLSALRATVCELDASEDVRAIVLTGADPAFCAGLDLTELGEPGSALGSAGSGPVLPPLSTMLIGAVNGAAVTGGLELALACDFLIASERARFADTHARVGIMPGWGLSYALPEAVGLRRARQMSATGNFVDARTALAWGLVNEVVPHAELLDVAVRLAADAASNDPAAVQAIFATYRSQVVGEAAAGIEDAARGRWHTAGIDRAEVARRRQAVIERGRSQAGSTP